MRTWGRVVDLQGNKRWVEVSTDPNGFNDELYVTTLAQVIKGNLGESPFFANYGLPAHQTVVTQVYPDFYVNRTQQQFSQFFASLVISRVSGAAAAARSAAPPTYRINLVTHKGSIFPAITIPTSIPT